MSIQVSCSLSSLSYWIVRVSYSGCWTVSSMWFAKDFLPFCCLFIFLIMSLVYKSFNFDKAWFISFVFLIWGLHWVSVMASGLLQLWRVGSGKPRLRRCGTRAPEHVVSLVGVCRLSCPAACRILVLQSGITLTSLLWQILNHCTIREVPILSSVDCISGVLSNNLLPDPRSWRFIPVFFKQCYSLNSFFFLILLKYYWFTMLC